jgi:hypothetical protein
MLTEAEVGAIKPRRYSRKVSDGGGLYLLVTPKGGRCWRYAYRFAVMKEIAPPRSDLTFSRLHNGYRNFVLGHFGNNAVGDERRGH